LSKHRILITGGGTGGHIYPALAVYEQLKADPEVEDILYIGAKGHLEERLTKERQVPFVGLNSAGMPRKLSPQLVTWPFKMLGAIQDARAALKKFRPTAVLGTGGYASAPPLAAALLNQVPFIIHEPDAHPGLVNRIFARWAALCSLGMEGASTRLTCPSGRIVVNGNPLGSKFLNPPSRAGAAASFGLKPDLKTLLVTGGSQGAQAINDAVLGALPQLLALEPQIQILHQVGEKNFGEFESHLGPQHRSERYQVRPYIDEMAQAYATSDLAVCRAGAMTIADLTVTATPALFVPYPFAAQDHQTSNARYIESKGAAIVIVQTDLTPEGLTQSVASVLQNPTKLAAMEQAMAALGKPQAAHDIAEQLKKLQSPSSNK
jgi:UDP-N-acetylglucosamine--N-acetylmuramyl-(pentapeptide) pyrophosphoryl-undecaprenol N-acetylglucosamine transferase